MKRELNTRNFVLVGFFKAMLFDKLFFIKNGIFTEDELENYNYDSLMGVSISFKNLNLTISNQTIIITDFEPKGDSDNFKAFCSKFLKSISNQTINVFGINLHWFISANSSEELDGFEKRNFYSENINLLKSKFNVDDAKYGVYASKNFKDSRLKLDVKPMSVQTPNDPSPFNVINFQFNLHFETKDKNLSNLFSSVVNDMNLYFKECDEILDSCIK